MPSAVDGCNVEYIAEDIVLGVAFVVLPVVGVFDLLLLVIIQIHCDCIYPSTYFGLFCRGSDHIRYVNVGRLRRSEGLAVYYPLGMSVPNGRAARY